MEGRGPELTPDGMELRPDEFELQLAQAMRRVDAPEGFAVRVLDQMGEQMGEGTATAPAQVSKARPGAPRVVMMQRRWAWAGGAMAAVLALGMFGTEQLHQRRERAERVAAEQAAAEQAALANQQFEAAVRVTDHALEQTREQLQRAGLRLGE
jgi:hypothetical protein